MKRSAKTFHQLLKRSLRSADVVRLPMMAGSLAFTTVLSIAPLLAVLFYVFMLFGGLDYAYDKLLPFLLNNLSEGTGEIVEEHLAGFVRQVHTHTVGWFGIVGLLVTSILTYFNIVGTFNHIWGVSHPKSFQHRILRAITLLTLGPVLLTGSVVITTALAAQVRDVPYSSQFVAFLLSATLFSLLYGLVPMVKVPARVILLGSLLPALLWELAKFAYAYYTKHMVTYSNIYGSFAALPLFLLWIYIGWCITLFGGVWVHTLQIYFEEKGHT